MLEWQFDKVVDVDFGNVLEAGHVDARKVSEGMEDVVAGVDDDELDVNGIEADDVDFVAVVVNAFNVDDENKCL